MQMFYLRPNLEMGLQLLKELQNNLLLPQPEQRNINRQKEGLKLKNKHEIYELLLTDERWNAKYDMRFHQFLRS
jgi:hypothetical protein